MNAPTGQIARAIRSAGVLSAGIVLLAGAVVGTDSMLGDRVGAPVGPDESGRVRLAAPASLANVASSDGFGVFFLSGAGAKLPIEDDLLPLASGGRLWLRAPGSIPDRLVLLVHGLDEPGSIWDEAAPAIAEAGYPVARLEYPNDQAIADSAEFMDSCLKRLKAAGVERIDIVAHSMGGLVTRDVLTRASLYGGDARGSLQRPDIERFITVGTPNHGSILAKAEWVADTREQVMRWISRRGKKLPTSPLAPVSSGQAGVDLVPGSAYLLDLNARPIPTGARLTAIVGLVINMDGLPAWAGVVGAAVAPAVSALGDGVVSEESTRLEGVTDRVELRSTHRGMLRTIVPKALSNLGKKVGSQLSKEIGAVVEQGKGQTPGAPKPQDEGAGAAPELPNVPPAIPIIIDRLAK